MLDKLQWCHDMPDYRKKIVGMCENGVVICQTEFISRLNYVSFVATEVYLTLISIISTQH